MRAKIRDTDIFFDVDGVSLFYDGGSMYERPTAFLIPGGPGTDHSGVKARYGKLAGKMQVVYFDHRGHGRSARGSAHRYTLDENVEDMEALRQYLGLGPIVSIGISYGGIVGMAHAARYPKSVSHLVLIATTSHAGYANRAREIVTGRGTAEQIAMCDDLFSGRLDTSEKLARYFDVMGPLYSRCYDPNQSLASRVRSDLSPDALNMAHGPGGFLRSFDLRDELHMISAPTLILAGRYDWICPPEFSIEIHRLIPDSDLRIFEESGHRIGGDEPQKLLDAIAGFLVYRSEKRGE